MSRCIDDTTLVEFVEGTLPAAQAASVEKHIAGCVLCRRRLIAVGASPSRIAEAPTAPAGVGAHLTLKPKTNVGRFEIRHEIGRGGMGIVFAAHDPQLDRNVALKLLHSASSSAELAVQAQERLLAEARAMARLDHPNIITVHEAGTFRQETYIVMELVYGDTLNQWIRRWDRSFMAILETFKQAGNALAHAHEHGIAHGDFKPENVLVDDRGRVRVTDFGLARWFGGERLDRAEAKGWPADARPQRARPMVMGTPRYMAPEQFLGHPADARSDQFSFCVALYEALYGRHPCAHDTPLAILKLSRDQALAPLFADAQGQDDIPRWLHDALARGLAPQPEHRYRSMRALLQALAPPLRHGSRTRIAVSMTAALILVCLIGYFLGAWQTNSTARTTPLDRQRPISVDVTEDQTGHPDPGKTTPMTGSFEPMDDIDPVGRGSRQGMASRVPAEPSGRVTDDSISRVLRGMFVGSTTANGASDKNTSPGNEVVLPLSIHEQGDVYSTTVEGVGADRGLLRELRQLLDDEIQRIEDRLDVLHNAREAVIWLDEDERDAEGKALDEGEILDEGDAPDDTDPPRRNGLRLSVVSRGVEQRWRELEVCFREWRERQPRGRRALTVQLHIRRNGRATVDKLRGLGDKVVRKCVTGALEAIRFRRAVHSTLVRLRFHSKARVLRMTRRLGR